MTKEKKEVSQLYVLGTPLFLEQIEAMQVNNGVLCQEIKIRIRREDRMKNEENSIYVSLV
jgi:hypothetical protein